MMEDDQRSVETLIAQALTVGDSDSHERWEPVREMHRRADQRTLEAAEALCRSHEAAERCLGCDILAQVGLGEKLFLDERLSILSGLADHESDLDVLYAALCALGHLGDQRAVEPLLRHRSHQDRDIRFAVASALPVDAGVIP